MKGRAQDATHRSETAVGGRTDRETPFWHPFANMAQVNREGEIVVVRGEGCEVFDRDGRRYLDAIAGLWYCNVGFGRESIVAAAERQMRELPAYSAFGPYANEPALELSERISSMAPLEGGKIFLTLGGSDAIDTAAKLVRRYWDARGKPEKRIIVGRRHAYHGMHAYGTSLAGIPENVEGLGEIVPEVAHVPDDSVEALAAELERLGPDRVGAFVGEPVIGAGGVIPPPEGYWPRVAELCRENDVLLIADEVITGWGRLGEWFGCERFGFEPDLITFAKGITSGYLPLAGVIVGQRVQEPFWSADGTWFRHGYTYSGHAAACAAALANLDVIEEEDLVGRVSDLEPIWVEKIRSLDRHPLVGEARAIGLLGAVELAPEALETRSDLAEQVVANLRREGVLTRSLRAKAIQLSPAFVITEGQIDDLVLSLERALEAVNPVTPDTSQPARSTTVGPVPNEAE
jgi:putrescine---pyruvate transaminase